MSSFTFSFFLVVWPNFHAKLGTQVKFFIFIQDLSMIGQKCRILYKTVKFVITSTIKESARRLMQPGFNLDPKEGPRSKSTIKVLLKLT